MWEPASVRMWGWSPQMHQKSGLQLLPGPSPSSFLRWTDSIVNIFVPNVLQKHTLPSVHRCAYSVYAYSWNLGTPWPSRKTASASDCCCSYPKFCLTLCLPHGLQQARLLCPSLSSGVCSSLCPFNQGCYNHLILWSLLLLFAFRLSQHQGLFQRVSQRIGASALTSNEYSGLISFRIDLFDLLAVQGTLKSLLHTMIWKHQFFSTQSSFPPQISSLLYIILPCLIFIFTPSYIIWTIIATNS